MNITSTLVTVVVHRSVTSFPTGKLFEQKYKKLGRRDGEGDELCVFRVPSNRPSYLRTYHGSFLSCLLSNSHHVTFLPVN